MIIFFECIYLNFLNLNKGDLIVFKNNFKKYLSISNFKQNSSSPIVLSDVSFDNF